MSEEKFLASSDRFLARFSPVVAALQEEAKCARWELSQKVFADALRRSAEKRFGAANPRPDEMEAYLKSLHLEDLALACACGEGNENAWEFFIAQFRQDVRNAADAI